MFSTDPQCTLLCRILQGTTPISILPKFKRSPNRRSKSRWEPLPDEKPIEKPAYANNNALKYAGWMHANEKDRKVFLLSLIFFLLQW